MYGIISEMFLFSSLLRMFEVLILFDSSEAGNEHCANTVNEFQQPTSFT